MYIIDEFALLFADRFFILQVVNRHKKVKNKSY